MRVAQAVAVVAERCWLASWLAGAGGSHACKRSWLTGELWAQQWQE
jgi:hypothetical protein